MIFKHQWVFHFVSSFLEKKPENTEKVEKVKKTKKVNKKIFLRVGRKLSLGCVLIPFHFVSIFSESNQIGSIEVEKMQILLTDNF